MRRGWVWALVSCVLVLVLSGISGWRTFAPADTPGPASTASQERSVEGQGQQRSELPSQQVGQDGAAMVLVPAGEFLMGSDQGGNDERPAHQVYLDAFYIDMYEVTNALYRNFVQATGRRAPHYWNYAHYNAHNQPVVGLTWDDAEAYCRWVRKRLPTEAEWEKAARGTDGRTYPWGNQWEKTSANTYYEGPGKPTPVGSYEDGKSPYGAYDMAGNVLEWVADWYDANYYRNSPNRNPRGPDTGQYRVLRGGGWNSIFVRTHAHAAARSGGNPDVLDAGVGVRCAKAP